MYRKTILTMGSLATLLLMASAPQVAWSKGLFVANNGIDSPVCGSEQEPCRSISQAINNASNEDVILVGPGLYGDLNSDGDFNDPGEESAEVGFGCRCMIQIGKSITLLSRDGAETTVLDANDAILDVVNITADGVVFGGRYKGFTITGARSESDDDGVGVAVMGGNGVYITGNHALDNDGAGFEIRGNGHALEYNIASINGQGFDFAFTDEGHIVQNNTASANGNEVFFGSGFSVTGNGYTVQKNSASGNRGIGFLINSSDGASLIFEKNSVIGNRGTGIWIFAAPKMVITKNNIYGNLGEQVFFQSEALNCGLVNDSGSVIDATHNYWGAAGGPGSDPADNAGPRSNCDRSGTTIVEPFSKKPFNIKGDKQNVNDKFPPLGSSDVTTALDQTPCASGTVGTFTIGTSFKNTSQDSLSDLYFEVVALSSGNVLCNADAGSNGKNFSVPISGVLKPNESFDVEFKIGLKSINRFEFKVNLFGIVQ